MSEPKVEIGQTKYPRDPTDSIRPNFEKLRDMGCTESHFLQATGQPIFRDVPDAPIRCWWCGSECAYPIDGVFKCKCGAAGKAPVSAKCMKCGRVVEECSLIGRCESAWTKEPPKEPGWYWHRENGVVMPLRVVRTTPHFGSEIKVLCLPSGIEDVATVGGEWSGPLVPPE